VTAYTYFILAIGALLGSTVSGVTGVGGGMVYLPFLTWGVGIKKAVPYLTMLLLVSNVSRAYFSRGNIDWKLLKYLAIGAIPGAALGALFYTALSPTLIAKILGVYLMIYVALHFTRMTWPRNASLRSFVPVGAATGVVSAVVGGAGPVVVPWMLRYGLVKEAFIGTEAVGAALIHVVKLIVWGGAGVISMEDVTLLLPLSVLMVLGSYFGKLLITRMNVRVFRGAMVFVLAIIGIRFLLY
jgi:uncharacterized membrane protein YfcA